MSDTDSDPQSRDEHPDAIDISELHLDEGEAVELRGAGRNASRQFLAIINGAVFEISSSTVRTIKPRVAHFQMAHALESRPSTIKKAFGFFHRDYKPVKLMRCLACSHSHLSDEEKRCCCPVGSRLQSVDYPEVKPRQPRCVRGGTIFTRPQQNA